KTGEASPYKEWISIDDVYDYIYRKTIKSQTPLKTSVRQEGELVIARNPNPRIKKYDRIIDIPTGKQEFYGNSSIFGIDFGTTKSAVSIIHEGTPIIIRNERGEKFTPSVVAYLENDDVAVGTPAIIQAFADPDRAFFGVKRHIDERHPGWAISYGSPDSYVDIASKIFADLRNNAKKYSTDDKFQAVLCVPAYFTEKQKKAVYLAAKQGGFDVLRMIPEPVAAALAYGVEKDELIIVCDLGGGTFDVSIMEIGDGVAQVHVVNGDNLLGGIDFDKRIAEFLTDDFSKKHGVNLSNDKIAQMRLMEAAEQAKIALSELETTTIFVHNIYMDKLGGKSINVSLSREHFDKLTEDLVARVETCCQAAVKDSDWDYYDNHPEYYKKKIVFVGLSTQIPAVRKKIQEIFRAPVDFSVDPNDVVVIGASIHAGVLSGTVRDTMLLNVASMSLGVETSGSVMRCLVKRNTTIPTRKTEVFTTTEDNQTSACIHILQGERPMASDNKSLGGFYLEDIPPTYRGIPQIEVTFDIDANGVIKVSAEEKTVGKEKKLIISTYGELHNDSPFQMMDGTAITSTRN
ncbi:MAG: Hsp70 family protein, partial [Anaerolineae bacterium]|nr:Hsp70 family protein [Anaerolineae bacterium]